MRQILCLILTFSLLLCGCSSFQSEKMELSGSTEQTETSEKSPLNLPHRNQIAWKTMLKKILPGKFFPTSKTLPKKIHFFSVLTFRPLLLRMIFLPMPKISPCSTTLS